jgi:hypothetical protein
MGQVQSALCGNVILDSLVVQSVPHTMVVVLREMYTNVFTNNVSGFATKLPFLEDPSLIRDHVFLVEPSRDMPISSSTVCDLFHNELVVDGRLHYIFA